MKEVWVAVLDAASTPKAPNQGSDTYFDLVDSSLLSDSIKHRVNRFQKAENLSLCNQYARERRERNGLWYD